MTAGSSNPPGFEAEPSEARAVAESEVLDVAAAWPGDPLARYNALTARQAWYQAVSESLADPRAALVWEMHASGASYGQIAALIGVNRARAQQLSERGRELADSGEFDLLARPADWGRPPADSEN